MPVTREERSRGRAFVLSVPANSAAEGRASPAAGKHPAPHSRLAATKKYAFGVGREGSYFIREWTGPCERVREGRVPLGIILPLAVRIMGRR